MRRSDFSRGELARELARFGLASATGLFGGDEAVGRVRPAMNADAQRMQALGEDDVEITVAELAVAYRLLALKIDQPEMRAIKAGLEGAEESSALLKTRASLRFAWQGKPGARSTASGEPVAWFAGFLPSSAPKAALAVMLPGRSGGADAAPIASGFSKRIFPAEYEEGP